MGLVDKLKEILFDEEQVEIPVITKEEIPKKITKKVEEKKDEVVVKQIKTENSFKSDDDLFDMPRLKKENNNPSTSSSSNFTFPVFDDDDIDIRVTSRTSKRETKFPDENLKPQNNPKIYEPYKKATTKETTNKNMYSNDKKPFSPSPVISPVYGILNENYKKEDIVSRGENRKRLSGEKIDLDSVRKKAYGTLEDEIESILDEASEKPDNQKIKTDEITLADLETSQTEANTNKQEEIGEDDLFDLIDSLYVGKDD